MAVALTDIFPRVARPIIGMLHVRALPGAPGFGGDLRAVRAALLEDAAALTGGGVDGLMLENFGDAPFFPGRVPAETIAHLTALAAEVRRAHPQTPLGVNVLRNDGCSALAIAHAVGARFIRVNVLCGARVTDQGVIEGIAHELLRLRRGLGAESIAIFADVNVKHSTALGEQPLEHEVADVIERGGADAIIVSGAATAQQTSATELRTARRAAGETPVLVGSGATAQSIAADLAEASGYIVGSSLKSGGKTTNRVDPERVRALMAAR